ncbi:MAG: GAF domain-containing protein [Oscillospiraceae bacterium]|nr:GAF domain-containing protein [Oscillospiraceae bacterium]MBQ9411857.1 GAF domain-containing protein [Oscillospiraceae bacterium]
MENSKYIPELRRIREIFQFDFVSLALVMEGDYPLLTWVYATGNRNFRYRRIVLESGKGVAGGVYKTRRAMVLRDAEKELTAAERVRYPITIAEDLRSVAGFPLWKHNRVLGVLLLAFRESDRIDRALYEEVLRELGSCFCGFTVQQDSYDLAICVDHNRDFDPVPVYELVSYPVMRATEEERRRISRELHDGVVQELLGVQMLLRTMKYQNDREEILSLSQQADERINLIQKELRNVATRLRPVTLDDLGLASSLRSYFNWIFQNRGVTVRLHENTEGRRYATGMEAVFYRVCQEAVLNACKYSGCMVLDVTLTESEGYLTLEVTDKGVGFDPENVDVKGGGMGLPGMSDWAEMIDGELTYQSAPGKGTSVWLTAPVRRRELEL